MKRIALSVLLITGILSASNTCDVNKKSTAKYENMALATSNLTMGAKYMGMAIKYKKETLNSCFFSGHDKVKIRDNIKDMESIKQDLLNEAQNQRINARKRDITIHHR